MPVNFRQLLEATIRYLEDLKTGGVRHVAVAPATLAALAAAPPRAPTAPANLPPPRAFPVEQVPAELSFLTSALDREAKGQAMTDLRARAMGCVRCPHLANSRKNVVFGVGDIHSPLMFVGEAPGAEEDEQGEPFVGKAGQLLTRIIHTMGFSRKTVYIANILKCRPDTPGQATGNRKPTTAEMRTCLPYLLEQIDLIRPRVIVALGATAMEGLFGKPVSITRVRGQFQFFQTFPVMPTFHPAYLLRNQALSEKRKLWEDMLQVLARLGLPVSDKQRNYFLRA